MEHPNLDKRVIAFDLRGVGQMSVGLLRRDMPCARSLHKEIELANVCAGTLTILLDEEPVVVREGETLLISSYTVHEFVPPQGEVEALRLRLEADWLEAPFWDAGQRARFRALFSHSFVAEATPEAARLFGELRDRLHGELAQYYAMMSAMRLTALLLEGGRLRLRYLAAGIDAAGGMADMLEFLHTHCNEELTLGQLADHLGLSPSYCSKYFHDKLGITFTDFVNTMRVSDARYLLGHTELSVIDIAEDVGFSSIQTFNRVFRKNCGQSPSQYRARAKTLLACLPAERVEKTVGQS